MSPDRSALDALVIWGAAGGAWLATYWLHALLLVGATWLATRVGLRGRERAGDVLWRVALVGALVTATLRVAIGPTAGATLGVDAPRREIQRLEIRRVFGVVGDTARPPKHTVRMTSRLRPGASGWLAAAFYAWIAGALVMMARYWRVRRRIGTLLSLRRPLADEEAGRTLEELARAAGLREPLVLSVCDELAAPAAIGRREIVLPSRAWVELTPGQRRSVLAHEVAHLRHRDPAWLAALGALRAVFWVQPLNAFALREWGEAAEFRCDDWAAAATGRPKALASALAAVAAWVPTAHDAAPMAALLGDRSPLVRRVERLVSGERAASKWPMAVSMVAASCAIILLVGSGPAVGLRAPANADQDVRIVRRVPVQATFSIPAPRP